MFVASFLARALTVSTELVGRERVLGGTPVRSR